MFCKYLFTAVLLSLPCWINAQTWPAGKVSVELSAALETEPGRQQRVQLLLADRLEPRALERQFRRQGYSLQERSEAMIKALQQKAAATQPAVMAELGRLPGIAPESIRSYWVANLIFCDANKEAVVALAEMPEVEWIDINWAVEVPDAVESCPAPPVPGGREPGLDWIGAPFMWEMGYTGYGQKVLILDTGHDVEHPAIQHNFAYHQVPMEQAWANAGGPYYCDSHGTHVSGTIIGLDPLQRDTIGAAFGAQWLGSGAQFADCGASQGNAEDFISIFEWAADPDGNPATTEDQPDVINNSWSRDYPVLEDCFNPVTRSVVDALYAMGVAVVFSASNEGPDPATIGNPPMENWDTVRMFSVGAIDATSPALNIADFSSRGPTVCGGTGSLQIKPEVSAPGVEVRSCVPGGRYAQMSGTSMAAPHVSGALLLLKEAFPYLDGETLKLALFYSATDLGAPGEDNAFGRGMIHLQAAYNHLLDLGHVPVPPVASENDISLLRLQQVERSCSGQLRAEALVEHNGSEPVQAFTLAFRLDNVQDTLRWEGELLPGERLAWELPVMEYSTGEHELVANIIKVNGEADARRLDNQKKAVVEIFSDEPIPAELVNATPLCRGGGALLRSLYEGPASVAWFDAPEGGAPLGEGETFFLPTLGQDTTLYAAFRPKPALGAGLTEAEQLPEGNEAEGLSFTALHPFRLKSVRIHTSQAGGRIIRLSGPEVGFTKIVQLQSPGTHRIPLDFQIPAAEGYELTLSTGAGLAYQASSSSAFPYTVSQVARIDSSTTGTQEYRYFFDWEIEYDYFCDRTPVTIVSSESAEAGSVDILASAETVDLATESGQVDFTAMAQDAVGWFWDFGDGQTSSIENPVHTYADTGSFTVHLVVETAKGCSDAAAYELRVTDSTPPANVVELEDDQRLQLFPNPTDGTLHLQFNLPGIEDAALRVFDPLGRALMSERRRIGGQAQETLSVGHLPSGAYFLSVSIRGQQFTRPFFKQ